MGPEALVSQPNYEEGKKALAAVKAAGISVKLGFWANFQDAAEWRLVVVAPALNREGPRRLYAQIQKAFADNNVHIPLRLVSLTAPQDPVARFGLDCGTSTVRVYDPGYVTTSTGEGAPVVTVDPRYIYRDI